MHTPIFVTLLGLMASGLVASVPAAAASPQLSPAQKEKLRFQLDNIFNDVDLVIRNHRVDLADLSRIRKEEVVLGVYERIPFKEDLSGLKRGLAESAKERGLKLRNLTRMPSAKTEASPVPSQIESNQRFRLRFDQVVETIPVELEVAGEENTIQQWVKDWVQDPVRLVEVDATDGKRKLDSGSLEKVTLRKNAPNLWKLRAHAFRFKQLSFPKIRIKDPESLLPAWAKKNHNEFAKSEPKLWSLVQKTKELMPRAQPLFEVRREFLLEQARFDFFAGKMRSQTQQAGIRSTSK